MATSEPYKYLPLQYPDSIRLLHIRPSQDADAPVQCLVTTQRLSDTWLNYEALSYTWGDASKPAAILIGDNDTSSLTITQNCFAALRSLRQRVQQRTVWIDAICINQDDVDERTAQVRMMDKIFSSAPRTIVYLGEETDGSRTVFSELAEAQGAPRMYSPVTGADVIDRPIPCTAVVDALEELLQCPWFRRIWVVQEVHCSSSKSLTVMCGRAEAPWTVLHECLLGYRDHRVTRQELPVVFDIYRYSSDQDIWYGLFNHAIHTRAYLSTDPRDRLFALKALLDGPQEEMDCLIDYSKSVEEVFAEFAGILFSRIGVQMLCLSRHPHNRAMASWMPDWSQNTPIKQASDYVHDGQVDYDSATGMLGSAKIISSPSSETLGVYNSLSVCGTAVGEVNDIGPPVVFTDHGDATRQWSHIIELLHLPESGIRDHLSAHPESPFTEHFLRVARGTSIQQISEFLDRGSNKVRFGPLALALTGPRVETNSRSPQQLMLMNHEASVGTERINVLRDAWQHCRAVAIGDTFLGIAPDGVQLGDVAYLVEGAISPCLLRPGPSGRWALVSGDCYVTDMTPKPVWPGRPGRLIRREGLPEHASVEDIIIC
ncbi:uncharacterized protein E0L32_006740 [Thyridium curvatum]|uniref:Heterokaryon incompatibility domain-containing protein n=1 Tax=Thyridium curvatum TaxID=1093900 RepID=A0A507B895_9PEZI|nr:uncharacterized protein E0L32_006740 [Thyridium curvatum]TPX12860.1 hypothetical protein E0L32_006740 [Thyridium curvatum]